MSGLTRPSSAGPRLEKIAMSLALSAAASPTPQPSVPPNGWTLSAAPTVITFFAAPGEPMVLALGPALPAEKTMTISWLPAAGNTEAAGWASRTSAS